MRVMGIETSCDETAVAVVDDGVDMQSNIIASSLELHAPYGGVVPEIAARSHLEVIIPVIEESLKQAGCSWREIDGLAVTHGAGLAGSLLIGVMTARTLSIVHNKPLIACNHVMGHVYANFITRTSMPGYVMPRQEPIFPLLSVILSGGHSQLVLFDSHFKYRLLGRTQDDAVGEAFDKVAKLLGLPYPGGPSVAKAAINGDSLSYRLPKAKMSRYDFSFAGLKTAVLRLAQDQIGESYSFPSFKLSERLSVAQKANIAASFQRVAVETIVDKVRMAAQEFQPKCILLAGGVAANQALRQSVIQSVACPVIVPDTQLCTDNGAMIAALGGWQLAAGMPLADPYRLDVCPNLSM